MTDDKQIRTENPELDEAEHEDPTLTKRITRPDAAGSDARTAAAASTSEQPSSRGIFQQMWQRIQEERNRPKRVELSARGQNNMDRSKAFWCSPRSWCSLGLGSSLCFPPPARKTEPKRDVPSRAWVGRSPQFSRPRLRDRRSRS
jgi:hypothetical protein